MTLWWSKVTNRWNKVTWSKMTMEWSDRMLLLPALVTCVPMIFFQMWVEKSQKIWPTCVYLGLWWDRKWLSDPCWSCLYSCVHCQWCSSWVLCWCFSSKKSDCFLPLTVECHDTADRFCNQILALGCYKICSWDRVSVAWRQICTCCVT